MASWYAIPVPPPAIIYLGFHEILEGYPHTLARDSDPFARPTSPSRTRRTSNIGLFQAPVFMRGECEED